MNSKTNVQQAELLDLNEKINAIQAMADAEKRDLTSTEDEKITRFLSQFKAVERELTSQSQGRISEPQQPGSHHQDMTRGQQFEIATSQRKPFAGRKMVDLFGKATVNKSDGFKSNAEFLQAVANGLHHPALVRAATMTTGTGADGGFSVPSQLIAEIFDESLEDEIIRPRAHVYPMMESNELNLSSIDYTDHSSNIGGLDAKWMAETETATAQKAKFRMLTLRAKKLGIFTEASSELVMDGLTFERTIVDAMAKSLAFDLDYAFIRGNGVGQPLGVLNAPGTISVARESGQAADTLIFENIVNMWGRLHPSLVNDAIWLINPDALPQLLSMGFPSGSTSSQTPLFLPSQAIADKHAGTIFGRPLFYSEKCSALGDQGDIILTAPSMYAIGMRLDSALDRSIHEGFMSDLVNFRLITRVDGQPIMNAAVTPRFGNSTLSSTTILDDRA